MVILHSNVINYVFAYFKYLKHVIINLDMIHHKLINNQVEMSALARKLHKSSINVVVINRKAWSANHCIVDHIIVINQYVFKFDRFGHYDN